MSRVTNKVIVNGVNVTEALADAEAELEIARLGSRLDALYRSKYEYVKAENDRLRESLAAIAEGECEQTVRAVGAHLETCEEEMPLNNSKWCGTCIARRALAPTEVP